MPKNKKPRKKMDQRKILDKKMIGYQTYTPIDDGKPAFSTKSSLYSINFKTR